MSATNAQVPVGAIDWFNEQIKGARISHRELSAISGIHTSVMSRGLSGQRPLAPLTFERMVLALDRLLPSNRSALEEAIWRYRMPTQEILRRSGASPRDLSRLLAGDDELVSDDARAGILEALGIDVDAVVREVRSPQPKLGGTIAIYEAPMAGGDGWHRRDKKKVESRPMPSQLEQAEGAYGLFVGDSAWEPRWFVGEVIFVHPGRPPRIGDWLLVDMDDGRVALGRMTGRSDGRLALASPGGETTGIAEDEVAAIGIVRGSWAD